MNDKIPARLSLKIISPGRLLVDREVEAVFLPSLEGQLGIYPGHAPFFIGLGKGELVYKSGEFSDSVHISRGYAQVLPHEVVVITGADGDED